MTNANRFATAALVLSARERLAGDSPRTGWQSIETAQKDGALILIFAPLAAQARRLELLADHNNDRNAALRLCALKVAAMIGEGME